MGTGRVRTLRNDLSSRLQQSGSSPRQTYHCSVTTRSHLVAPTHAPPWGQVTGTGKRHHRTAEHLPLQRKIYTCRGITKLSAVMLLYLAAGKVQHTAWEACPESALKHLLATECDPQAVWARAGLMCFDGAGLSKGPCRVLHWAALSCTLLGTWEGKKTQTCVLVCRGRKAGTTVTCSRSHNSSDDALQSHWSPKTPQPLLPLKCKCPSVNFLI